MSPSCLLNMGAVQPRDARPRPSLLILWPSRMKRWLVRLLFGPTLDRLADDAVDEFTRLSHCHRCGACVCQQHEALSDDTWDQHRVICAQCEHA